MLPPIIMYALGTLCAVLAGAWLKHKNYGACVGCSLLSLGTFISAAAMMITHTLKG